MLLPSVSLLSSRWFANQSRVEIAGVWPLTGRPLSFKEVFTSARADQKVGNCKGKGQQAEHTRKIRADKSKAEASCSPSQSLSAEILRV